MALGLKDCLQSRRWKQTLVPSGEGQTRRSVRLLGETEVFILKHTDSPLQSFMRKAGREGGVSAASLPPGGSAVVSPPLRRSWHWRPQTSLRSGVSRPGGRQGQSGVFLGVPLPMGTLSWVRMCSSVSQVPLLLALGQVSLPRPHLAPEHQVAFAGSQETDQASSGGGGGALEVALLGFWHRPSSLASAAPPPRPPPSLKEAELVQAPPSTLPCWEMRLLGQALRGRLASREPTPWQYHDLVPWDSQGWWGGLCQSL